MDQFKEDVKKASDRSEELNLLRMLESRIVEVIQIEKEVRKKYPKLYIQRLPRYMRRRAASHNPHRIPSWIKASTSKRTQDKLTARDRKKLYRFREKQRRAKHKRILNRHARHSYKDSNKSILHKWFAKRFKIETKELGLEWVPLHNNTKNFRNLNRQTRYGCAYFSMAHLISFDIQTALDTPTIAVLNKLCHSVSGFTFAARSLEKGRYEIVIHLYKIKLDERGEKVYEHVCPAFTSANIRKKSLTLWVPRVAVDQVQELLETTGLPFSKLVPRERMRLRLVGPDARKEAIRIASNKPVHEVAFHDVDHRLLASRKFGLTIGRHIEEESVCFTHYQTYPQSVDLVIRNKRAGRMLWHKLIRDKAHLVGGKRDVDEIFKDKDCFQLKPDFR